MIRRYLVSIVCLLLCGWQLATAQDKKKELFKHAAALQQLVQKHIKQIEPSIACILVSRSERYRKFGYEYPSYETGKLGAYHPGKINAHLKRLGVPFKDREAIIQQLDLADSDNIPESYGSGVVIDPKGLILTHYHVVSGATKIYVRLPNNKESYADIFAADPRSDLAVLKLHDSSLRLPSLALGSGEKIKRGQFVLALCHPFAAGFNDGQVSASWGMISNVRRRAPTKPASANALTTIHHFGTLLQTDARLQFGCSGGALINLDGEVIALTSALAAVHGIDVPGGFAVPLDAPMRKIIEILSRGEEVEYGFMGISFEPGRKLQRGVVLAELVDGSPAQIAGLKEGDTIYSVNGTPIHNLNDMSLSLATMLAGEKVTLEVRRKGKTKNEIVSAVLSKLYVPGKIIAANGKRPFFRGIRVDQTSLVVQCKFPGIHHESIPKGVLISDVQLNSPAAAVLLKPGEIITHVNNRPVHSVTEFYQLVKGIHGPVDLTLVSLPGHPAPKVLLN